MNKDLNQDLLREKLNHVIASGLVARAISVRSGVTTDVLSRFKNGLVYLREKDANNLKNYLDKVVLPD